MSGRIRQLKPDFLLDEEFWALKCAHPELHLHEAFEGLWCHADREGRFEWRPQMLKAKVLPYWAGDFARVLEVLTDAGCVVSYEVDGKRYGWVRSFGKHQRPNSREPASTLPPPPVYASPPGVSAREHARADESPRASLPPLPIPIPTPNTQHPTHSSAPESPPPEVPGLVVVYPGPLQPSKRDQARNADPTAGQQPPGLRYRFRPDWAPSVEHGRRAQELGLTREEVFERAEDCLHKPIKHGFHDEDEHFFRELAWLKTDKEKRVFKSAKERDAFENPGRERRAGS